MTVIAEVKEYFLFPFFFIFFFQKKQQRFPRQKKREKNFFFVLSIPHDLHFHYPHRTVVAFFSMSELHKLQQFFQSKTDGGDRQRFAAAAAAAAFEVDGMAGEVSIISSAVTAPSQSPQSTVPSNMLTPNQKQSLRAIQQSLKLPEGTKGKEYEKYLQKLLQKLHQGAPPRSDITAPQPNLSRKLSTASTKSSLDPSHYHHVSYTSAGGHQLPPQSNISASVASPSLAGDESLVNIMQQVEDEIERDTAAAAHKHAIAKSLKDKAAFVRSKAFLSEQEDVLAGLHATTVTAFDKQFQEVLAQSRRVGQAMLAFDRDCAQCAVPPDDDVQEDFVAQMEEECGLVMTQAALKQHIVDLSRSQPTDARQLFSELAGSKTATSTVSDFAACGVESDAAALSLEFHAFLNSELFNTSTTMQRLEAANREAAELTRTVSNRQRIYQRDPTNANQTDLGTALEGLLATSQLKVALLGSVCGAPAMEDITAKREAARGFVHQVTVTCDALDATLDDDAKKICDSHSSMLEENERVKSEARQAVQACDAKLAENASTQKALAEKTAELLKMMQDAGAERALLVSKRMQVMEESATEQRRFESRRKCVQDHVQLMKDMKECLIDTITVNHEVFLKGMPF